jgi:hypothetical protein
MTVAGAGAAFLVLVIASDAIGQTRPLPMASCGPLKDAIALAVAIEGKTEAEIDWFRNGDLGIKGRRCLISLTGVAKKKPGKPAPKIKTLATQVRKVLVAHGWSGGKEILGRYDEATNNYVSFALRKERATCLVEIDRERPGDILRAPGQKTPKPSERPLTLEVSCFVG